MLNYFFALQGGDSAQLCLLVPVLIIDMQQLMCQLVPWISCSFERSYNTLPYEVTFLVSEILENSGYLDFLNPLTIHGVLSIHTRT